MQVLDSTYAQRNSQYCFGETPIWIANWIRQIKICFTSCKAIIVVPPKHWLNTDNIFLFWDTVSQILILWYWSENGIYKIQCKYFRVHSAENRWNNFGRKQPYFSICIDLWSNSTSCPKIFPVSRLKRPLKVRFDP